MHSMVRTGAVLAAMTLAACAPPQGSGFSGIGSEQQSVTSAGFSSPATPTRSSNTTWRLDPTVPALATRAKSENRGVQAETAVLAADRKDRVSQPVRFNGEDLRLSVVYVDNWPFAVLRPPSSLWGSKMRADGNRVFHSKVRELTGCPAASGVYTYDTSRRDGVTGMAILLACG